jgi:hypothetical protein
MDRREFIQKGAFTASATLAAGSISSVAAEASEAPDRRPKRQKGYLGWLDGHESLVNPGSTWGQAWPEGVLRADDPLTLINEQGNEIALQSWPTAFWPDGSIKWTAHSVPADAVLGKQFKVAFGVPVTPDNAVSLRPRANYIEVHTGTSSFRVERKGNLIISGLSLGDKNLAGNLHLTGLLNGNGNTSTAGPGRERFQSWTRAITVEQEGPVRSVIRVEGVHRMESGREWLPFTLRLYFYAGATSIRISHTFVFDGDEQSDFIAGLGLRFKITQRDETYNRHIRFAGQDGGIWGESPQGITGLRRDPGIEVRNAQIEGRPTPPIDSWNKDVSKRMHWVPVWNDYTLTQINANGFGIKKRTKQGYGWIDADQGSRAAGVAYAGGASGGVLFGMRDFWQLHPVQIDIRNAGLDESEATMWFWSPEAPPMDLRFYHDGMGQDTYEDQLDALQINYEDYEPGFDTAKGIGRTTDFILKLCESTPSREETVNWTNWIRQPSQVVSAPEDLLAAGVFGGLWSLPDRSSKSKRRIEDRLDWQIDFYRKQVDQRHWYGFWNYGDVMHTYDEDRHVWRYDIGGFAWANSELSPDLWLWYSYLRSGDASTFRLAEAMTRHTRDVDIYHLGRFKGLGTRHNVQHWGCSAKQLRVSTAAYRRFHYYLTGDDRTGDVLNEVIDASHMLEQVEPTRKLPARLDMPGPARIQVGTDWGSVAANWLTAWERTGKDEYRDRLVRAMRAIGNHPQGFFAGEFGFDPKLDALIPGPDEGPHVSHLSAVFGLFEINAELIKALDVPEYKEAWLKYCRLYNASEAEQSAEFGQALKGNNLAAEHSRLTAYAAAQDKNPALAKRAWQEMGEPQQAARLWRGEPRLVREISGPSVLNPVEEAPWISTNNASQWGLAAIQNLALISDAMDD